MRCLRHRLRGPLHPCRPMTLTIPFHFKDARMERECPECEAYDRVHDNKCRLHPDYDPTPTGCSWCGDGPCRCPPIADNE